MRVTQKGQVTIPKEIRDRLGIEPGSSVAFVPSEGGAMLVKLSSQDSDIVTFDDWAGSVSGLLDLNGMSTDAYMDWIRGSRDDLDPD